MAKKIICVLAVVALVVSCLVVPTFAVNAQGYFDGNDYAAYNTLNAFPFPYVKNTGAASPYVDATTPKISIKQNLDGFGSATAYFLLEDWQTGLAATGPLTFSAQIAGERPSSVSFVDVRCQVMRADGTINYYVCSLGSAVTFVMNADDTLNVYMRFTGAPVLPVDFYPVLNFATSSRPYQPYVNYYLTEQYNAGYQYGYNHGYNAGFDEGYLDAVKGFEENEKISPLRFATLKCYATAYSKTDGTTGFFDYVVTVPSSYYVNAFDDMPINPVQEYVLSVCNGARPDVYWNDENTSYTFEFSWEDSFMSSFEYSTGFFGAYIVSQDGVYIVPVENIRIEGVQNGSIVDFFATAVPLSEDDDIDSDKIFNYTYQSLSQYDGTQALKVSFTFQQFSENLSARMTFVSIGTALSPSYSAGYTAGYLAGQKSNTSDEALEAAYQDGRLAGFAEGKKEGLELAEDGDWLSLFTAVIEAPVVAFQSLFNFTIFGFDMRNMITSLLTICVFIVILKKVGAV